jgi:plasmid replication initiation protein
MKTELELITNNKLITLSNALTRAGCALTLSEKRIVMLAVSKLNSLKPVPTHSFCTKITAAEYAEAYDVEIHTAYEQLQSAAKNLYNRSLTFYEPAHRRNGKPLKPIRNDMRWVGQATYHEGEAWVELDWWYRILPHLMGIKKQFTEYRLKQATALRSVHSWRLLELLMRFKSTGWAEYTIEDFALSMQATEKQSSDFGKIRTQIIEPAVKELIEKDGWQISWQPIKAGRRVKALRFEFSHEYREKVKEGMTGGQGIAADAVFDQLETKYQTMLSDQV